MSYTRGAYSALSVTMKPRRFFSVGGRVVQAKQDRIGLHERHFLVIAQECLAELQLLDEEADLSAPSV